MNTYVNSRDEVEHTRAVLKYREVIDDKGRTEFVPIFLRETPKEDIERMNKMFTEWRK